MPWPSFGAGSWNTTTPWPLQSTVPGMSIRTEADHAARPSPEQAKDALQGLDPKHHAFVQLEQIEALRPSAPK